MSEPDSCFEWEEIKDPVLKEAFKKLDRHIHDTIRRSKSLLNLFDLTISMKGLELAVLEVKKKELIEVLAKKAELKGMVLTETKIKEKLKEK
jgi:hypothetical protein